MIYAINYSLIAFLLILFVLARAEAHYFCHDQAIRQEGVDGFERPEGIFLADDGSLYLADTGNNRILKFDGQGNLLLKLGEFKSPGDVFLDEEGSIYVADSGNGRILKFDCRGNLLREFGKPEEFQIFRPTKIAVDKRGYVYVVDSSGICLFDQQGRFSGYLARMGKRRGQVHMPSDICIDQEGYIYITNNEVRGEDLRNLVSVGEVLKFDYQGRYLMSFGGSPGTRFSGITVDELGNLFVLNREGGNIYKFDQEGELIFIFGSQGIKRGQFMYPSAIDVDKEGRIYVTDYYNRIQVLEPSKLARVIDQANFHLLKDQFDQAATLWREAIRLNNYIDYSYLALGRTYLKQKRWKKALNEFRLIEDRKRYSRAIKDYRRDLFTSYLFQIVASFLILVGVSINLRGNAHRFLRTLPYEKFALTRILKNGLGLFSRPIRTMERIGREETLLSALIIISLLCLISYLTGKVVSPLFSEGEEFTIFLSLKRSFLYFLAWFIWSTASYGMGDILEGRGQYKDILIVTSFCFFPYLLFSLPLSLISNLLTLEEGIYFELIHKFLLLWSFFLVIVSARVLHKLSELKTLLLLFLSALTGLLIFGFLILIASVNKEMFGFFDEIIKEIYNHLV